MAEGRGSHRASLLRVAERAIVEEDLFPLRPKGKGGEPPGRVLVACSGGPDSTALLHVLARLAPRLGFAVAAHGVDHGLRTEAGAELQQAARVAEALGVPFGLTRVDVAQGGNLQARARQARIGALVAAATAVGACAIATGHTADDRAETVLMRLLRGAGPRGLAVLPPRACAPVANAGGIYLVRPLVRARRDDVLAYLARNGLPAATDPSNADPRFLRARVRLEILPALAALSPRIVEHLSDLADMLAAPEPRGSGLQDLGREQQKAVQRARRLGRPGVLLRVRGGRDVEVTFTDGGHVEVERTAKDRRGPS